MLNGFRGQSSCRFLFGILSLFLFVSLSHAASLSGVGWSEWIDSFEHRLEYLKHRFKSNSLLPAATVSELKSQNHCDVLLRAGADLRLTDQETNLLKVIVQMISLPQELVENDIALSESLADSTSKTMNVSAERKRFMNRFVRHFVGAFLHGQLPPRVLLESEMGHVVVEYLVNYTKRPSGSSPKLESDSREFKELLNNRISGKITREEFIEKSLHEEVVLYHFTPEALVKFGREARLALLTHSSSNLENLEKILFEMIDEWPTLNWTHTQHKFSDDLMSL